MKKSHFEINTMDRKPGFYMKGFHSHSWYELFFLESGKCEYSIGDSTWTCDPGAIVIVAPNVMHGTSYIGNAVSTRVNIEFSEDYISLFKANRELDTSFNLLLNGVYQLQPRECAIYKNCLKSLMEENATDDAFSPIMRASALIQIFTTVLRSSKSSSSEERIKHNNKVLSPALLYIEMNYNKKITLDMMAQMCHLTPSYFSAKFKAVCGCTFKEYLTNTRIIQAERLLLETDKSIAEIAFFCGFESSNYFGDAFKKKNSISPSQFRMTKGIHS